MYLQLRGTIVSKQFSVRRENAILRSGSFPRCPLLKLSGLAEKKRKEKKERVFLHAISDRYIKASRKNVIRSYLKSEF